MEDNFTLQHRLKFVVEYCEKKNIPNNSTKFQQYLTDALQRYILKMRTQTKKDFEIINCVRTYYSNKEYQKEYTDLTSNLSAISETNRLLLIKCICLLKNPGTSINNIVNHEP